MSDTTTRGIRIQVESVYVPAKSSPADNYYFFAYTIRISNLGQETAQLISRHWIILSADGKVGEVEGPGVVGEQPVLAPGQSFEYTSFCPLPTPIGSMRGSYHMQLANGESFDAAIGLFSLAVPTALN